MNWESIYQDIHSILFCYIPASIIIGIVITVIIVILKAILSGTSIRNLIRKNGNHYILRFLLSVYLAFLFIITIFNRYSGMRDELHLVPFSSFFPLKWHIFYPLSNLLLFIPLGILLPSIRRIFNHPGWCIATGFFLSVLVEVIQFVTKRGYFETDDLLMNTLGAAVGFGISRIIRYHFLCLSLGVNQRRR